MQCNTLPPFQSYFWLYAPAGPITPKKVRKTGELVDVFKGEANGDNPLSAKLCDIDHAHALDTLHLTIFEQPRTPEKKGEYRYQPVQSVEAVLDMVESAQNVAMDYIPMELGGNAIQIIEKTNKLHMALSFNPEANRVFEEFYEDLMDELAEERVHDLYKETRTPRVFLGKAYKSEFGGVDIKSARQTFNNRFAKFPTKPVMFDRLILGQGFYDVTGKNLGRRDVATIHFDGKPFDWHCDNPFDDVANQRLISQTADVRGQALANGPRRPSLVS
jgi:hypothetical protein